MLFKTDVPPTTAKQVIAADHRGRVLPLGTMQAIFERSGVALAEWLNRVERYAPGI